MYVITIIISSIIHKSSSCQPLRLLSECKMVWQQQQESSLPSVPYVHPGFYRVMQTCFIEEERLFPSLSLAGFSFSPRVLQSPIKSFKTDLYRRGPILQEINSECHVFSMIDYLLFGNTGCKCCQCCCELLARYCSTQVCGFWGLR